MALSKGGLWGAFSVSATLTGSSFGLLRRLLWRYWRQLSNKITLLFSSVILSYVTAPYAWLLSNNHEQTVMQVKHFSHFDFENSVLVILVKTWWKYFITLYQWRLCRHVQGLQGRYHSSRYAQKWAAGDFPTLFTTTVGCISHKLWQGPLDAFNMYKAWKSKA